jgi:predicted  nucleic acid-binding Zn-ribbon protein
VTSSSTPEAGNPAAVGAAGVPPAVGSSDPAGAAGCSGGGAGAQLSPLALLLAVQARDLAAEQLAYRRRELPGRAELAALDRRGAALRARLAEIQSQHDELGAAQERLDHQVDMLTSRMAAIESRLSSGAAGSFRDQEAMANETVSLGRQRRSLEDQELEIMEALEPIDAELSTLHAQLTADEEARAAVVSALSASEAVLDQELAAVAAERDSLAAGLPADLAAIYERLRVKLGGVGAAQLVDGACSGCHLKLPARERDVIQHAPEGTVFYCEQCGRILVP